MILVIAGDRHYLDWAMFSKTVSDHLERVPATEIHTGDATGTDAMALSYALIHDIPYLVHCASPEKYQRFIKDGINAVLDSNWHTQGPKAGPIRNFKMIQPAHAVLLFDGGGPGSANVRKLAEKLRKIFDRWVVETRNTDVKAAHM